MKKDRRHRNTSSASRSKPRRAPNDAVLDLTEREKGLHNAILSQAPRSFNRLVDAGCDPSELIFRLNQWAWTPAILHRCWEKLATPSGEIRNVEQIASRLRHKASKTDCGYLKAELYRAGRGLHKAARFARHLNSKTPGMSNTDSSLSLFHWVENETGRQYVGSVSKLLEVTASHFNSQINSQNLPESRISLPNKSSLQALLRRHRSAPKN